MLRIKSMKTVLFSFLKFICILIAFYTWDAVGEAINGTKWPGQKQDFLIIMVACLFFRKSWVPEKKEA
jgi:hypothetical protein